MQSDVKLRTRRNEIVEQETMMRKTYLCAVITESKGRLIFSF